MSQNMKIARKFVLQLMNWIPASEDPLTQKMFDQINSNTEAIKRVNSVITPVLDRTGFFKNTQFISLGVTFELFQQSELNRAIKVIPIKSPKILSICKPFYKSELLPAFESGFENFAVTQIASILRLVCEKYHLNLEPIEQLKSEVSAEQISIELQPREVNTIEIGDELRINVKLSDREFGDLAGQQENTILMDDLDELLHKNDLGKVVGAEIGMGYETIFCIGDNANAMFNRVRQRLKRLPRDSYVEIMHDGKTDRVYPEQLFT